MVILTMRLEAWQCKQDWVVRLRRRFLWSRSPALVEGLVGASIFLRFAVSEDILGYNLGSYGTQGQPNGAIKVGS